MKLRTAYINYLSHQPKRRSDNLLWVSDLGMHPYKAMNRIINRETEDFPPATISAMEDGNMMEAHSISIWTKALTDTVHTQVPLYNNIWSGYADAVLNLGTANPIIVEHKVTKDAGWKFDKERGPIKAFHACQLWMYGQLFYQRYGIHPKLTLYYRSMGDHWAELDVATSSDGFLYLQGHLDGKSIDLSSDIRPQLLRDELENYYRNSELPEAPIGQVWDYAGKLTVV